MKKIFNKHREDEKGQAVIILASMIFVTIALLVLAAVSAIDGIRNRTNLIDAAVAAAINGVSAGTELSSREFDEDAAVLAACQTMDEYLPIRVLSVGFGRSSMRVTVSKTDSEGEENRATYTTFYGTGDESESSGDGVYRFGTTLSVKDIIAKVDGCQGRVVQ